MERLTKEELGTIIMDNKNLFYHVAKSILPNDDDCADAISEMIVKGYAKMDKIKNKNAAKAWLVRILVHECYNILRHPQALELPEDLAYEELKENRNLNDVLYELPDKLRTVLVLYYIEGYSVNEIAEMLACTKSAVKNRLLRARKQLRKLLLEDHEYA